MQNLLNFKPEGYMNNCYIDSNAFKYFQYCDLIKSYAEKSITHKRNTISFRLMVRAERLFKKIKENKNFTPSPGVYQALMQGYARRGNFRKVEEIFREYQKNDQGNDINKREIVEFLSKMMIDLPSYSYPISIRIYNILLYTYIEYDALELAQSLFEFMEKSENQNHWLHQQSRAILMQGFTKLKERYSAFMEC